jgi:hypothetical protein
MESEAIKDKQIAEQRREKNQQFDSQQEACLRQRQAQNRQLEAFQ